MNIPDDLETFVRLIEIDRASEPGDGGMNEDLSGATSSRAWMIDGSTDLPATFRPKEHATGAWWLANEVNRLLEQHPDKGDYKALLTTVAELVDDELLRLQMPEDSLPPTCSIGLVSLQGEMLEAVIVGDVYVYHVEEGDLLSDDRFDRNEKAAVRSASDETSDEAVAGIAERRRGYLRGREGQWVLANNPNVWRGALTRMWTATPGDHLVLASDGFARAVTSYGLFSDWNTLAREVVSKGAGHVMKRLREHESHVGKENQHFKSSDDACVAVYRLGR